MDRKKRKSILRTFQSHSQKDENTTDSNGRQKLRKSFRKKKSVRVFSNEDHIQVWKKSYELRSDAKTENSTDLLQAHSSSALCTTKECINKSDAMETDMDKTLPITLLGIEEDCIQKEGLIKPQIATKSAQNTNHTRTSNTNQSTTAMVIERTQQAIDSTSMNVDIACHDDNSNKENIVPEQLMMTDVHPSKKDHLSTKMDFDSSTTTLLNFEIFKKYNLNSKQKNINEENVVKTEKSKTIIKRRKPLQATNQETKKRKNV